jgi:hypothetical protein
MHSSFLLRFASHSRIHPFSFLNRFSISTIEGVWLGTFCRQKTNQGSSGDNRRGGNKKKNGQKKSNMVCDGGGWLRSEKQRTSFLLVIQDEIVKSPKKNEVNAIENGGDGGDGDDTKNTTIKLKKTISNDKKSNSGSSRKALKAIGNGNDTVASYSTSRAIVVKPMSNSNIRKLSSKVSPKTSTTTTTTKSSSNTTTNNDTKKVIKRASRSGSSMLSSDDRIESWD